LDAGAVGSSAVYRFHTNRPFAAPFLKSLPAAQRLVGAADQMAAFVGMTLFNGHGQLGAVGTTRSGVMRTCTNPTTCPRFLSRPSGKMARSHFGVPELIFDNSIKNRSRFCQGLAQFYAGFEASFCQSRLDRLGADLAVKVVRSIAVDGRPGESRAWSFLPLRHRHSASAHDKTRRHLRWIDSGVACQHTTYGKRATMGAATFGKKMVDCWISAKSRASADKSVTIRGLGATKVRRLSGGVFT